MLDARPTEHGDLDRLAFDFLNTLPGDRALSPAEQSVFHRHAETLADRYLNSDAADCVLVRKILKKYEQIDALKRQERAVQMPVKDLGLIDRLRQAFRGNTYRGTDSLPIVYQAMLDAGNWFEHEFRRTSNVIWLRRTLAAVSMEDMYTDFRDSFMLMASVCVEATRRGIDPSPHLQWVGERSNPGHAYERGLSVSQTISNFQQTACFREELAHAENSRY